MKMKDVDVDVELSRLVRTCLVSIRERERVRESEFSLNGRLAKLKVINIVDFSLT